MNKDRVATTTQQEREQGAEEKRRKAARSSFLREALRSTQSRQFIAELLESMEVFPIPSSPARYTGRWGADTSAVDHLDTMRAIGIQEAGIAILDHLLEFVPDVFEEIAVIGVKLAAQRARTKDDRLPEDDRAVGFSEEGRCSGT